MTKKNRITYEEKMISILDQLPYPIVDKKHGIKIYFKNKRARSNQSRYEHIVKSRHGLKPNDLERIPRFINQSTLRKDRERKDTFNIYIRRNSYNNEYIKISIECKDNNTKEGIVKTVFITKFYK